MPRRRRRASASRPRPRRRRSASVARADARAQIEAAKRALDELGGTLVAAASEAIPKAETPEPEPEPPSRSPSPRPESPGAPEAPISPPPGNGDDAAERLVAMKLAVEGRDRAAIEAELSERFGASDRSALLDDVLSRAAR